MAPPALLSAGSGDLLRCVPCCLLFRFSSNSSHLRLYFLLRPPAPPPPAALPPSHAFLTPPTPAPPAAGQVPAAPFHAAAAPTSHPPIHPAAPPPQPSANWSHEPLRQPWGAGTRLWPAAPWPGCPPIRDSLLLFPPLAKRRKEMQRLDVNTSPPTAPEGSTQVLACTSTSLTAPFHLKTEFSCLFSNASCDTTEVT